MFEIPAPQFVQLAPRHALLSEALRDPASSLLSQIRGEAESALKPLNTTSKAPSIGFFEQGLLSGMVMLMSPVVAGLSVLGYHGVVMAMRKFRG